MAHRGAGGSEGGTFQFALGAVLIATSGFLLLTNLETKTETGAELPLFYVGSFGLTATMLLIPFVMGLTALYLDSRRMLGWLLFMTPITITTTGVFSDWAAVSAQISLVYQIAIPSLAGFGAILLFSSFRGLRWESDLVWPR